MKYSDELNGISGKWYVDADGVKHVATVVHYDRDDVTVSTYSSKEGRVTAMSQMSGEEWLLRKRVAEETAAHG